MQRKNLYKRGWGLALLAITFTLQTGCKKLVEPDASNEKIGVETVFSHDRTAASVLTRILAEYTWFSEGGNGFTYFLAMAGDELRLGATAGNTATAVHQNTMVQDPTLWWFNLYKYLYIANDAIEMLSKTPGTTERVRNILIGEAKFHRALMYFYLVNTYGDVPLVLTTDYRVTAGMGRTPSAQIYEQIIKDLKDAKDQLSADYLNATMVAGPTVERVRPVKAAASALLARVYLYTGDYVNAEKEATIVINDNRFTLEPHNSAFLRTSKEAIFQTQSVYPGQNVLDGSTWNLNLATPTSVTPFVVSNLLLNAFETGDLRKTKWIGDSSGNRFFNKYKFRGTENPDVEAIMILRLGEQYLIRAEALIKQNKVADGVADLNKVRLRSRGTNPGDLPDLSTGLSQDDAIKAVEHERQVELFGEWGHRWFDLKRTNRIDAVMTIATPAKTNNAVQWQPYRKLWPIPASEIQGAPGLAGQQNPGWPQ